MRKSWIPPSLGIKRLLRYLTDIPDGSLNHPSNVERSRRIYILFSISNIGTIVLFLFGIIALIKKSYALGMLEFTLAFALAVNLLHARRYKNYNTNIYFGTALSAAFIVYVFLTGGVNTTGFVCYYIFPLVASFLLGSKKGAIATALISLPVVILFLMKTPPSIFTNYTFDFKLRFLFSFLVISVFSYLFEYSREQNQEELRNAHSNSEKQVDERTSALQQAIQSLQGEIGERRRAEEALRQSEEKYRNILESIQEGYFELDLDGSYTFVNDANCRLLGFTKEELVGMNYRQHSEEKTAKDLYAHYYELYLSGKPIERLDVEAIRKDGTKGIYETSVSLLRDSEGKPIGFRGVSRDVTERKRAEEVLRESERGLRIIFESIQAGVLIIDPETHVIVDLNPAALKLIGAPKEKIVDSICHKYICPAETGKCPITDLKQNVENAERVLLTANGESRQVIKTVVPILLGGRRYLLESFVDISERKWAEEALRESEEKYRAILENIEDGYYEADLAGNLTFFNDSMSRISRTPKEKLIGVNNRQYTDQENAKKMFQAFNKVYRTGEPSKECTWEITRRDGIKRHLEASISLRKDSSGKPIGFRGIVRDITERKWMEQALRESENKFRDLAEKSLIGVYLVQDGVFKYVNARLAEINGYAAAELIDKKGPKDLVFPEDWPMVEENTRKRLSGEVESLHFEFRDITKDNRIINVEVYGSRTMYQRRPAVVGTLLDITDRKRAEEKLRESEEKFRQLAENIREVFYISEQGITQYVSPAYMEIWGRSPQHLYEEPRSILDTVHPEDRDRVMKSLPMKNQGEVEEVYRIVRPDGSIRWIKDRSFPIYDDSGKTHRIVGIAADITDLKLGEEKLKYLSLHDSLTGLYNRIYFEEEISRIEKGRYDTVGILSCDVDGLKLVNDTLGHHQGDRLLIAAARVIRECFREGDLVARIGGDEFSILLPDTTESAVENACQRIQEAVAGYNGTNPQLPLSISVGFAINHGVYRNLKDLFKEADNHMYRKKLYGTKSVRSTIVKTLINTLKTRDHTAENHIIRLEKLLAGIAAFIGLPESTKSDLSLLAKFHDIGKVAIADAILFKEGPLTPEEWTEMKRHCEIGYHIALSAPELVPIADWILKHHEWWNGQGYPLGIEGEEIPVECRLLAIAETYEALTSASSYQKTYSHSEAVVELRRHSGKQFDPKLLESFLQMLEIPSLASEPNETAI
jgi:diguanylate cyclase (GGDEF)-like protein/PAS domain S-box-containing protein